jgi:hypothetical protein
MKRARWLGVALGSLLMGCVHGGYDRAGELSPSRMYDVVNFNGEWKLVPGSRDEVHPESDDWFLPDAFRIEGDRTTLRIEDDSGELLSEIAVDSDYRNGAFGADRNRTVHARWINDRRLEVVRAAEGHSITQTYSLGNRGRQLLVEIQVDRNGVMNTSTRVYRRV